MGRVMGRGFRIGNSCTPMADSCQCMEKPIQYCKVKKKIKIKKIKKKEMQRNTSLSRLVAKLQISINK